MSELAIREDVQPQRSLDELAKEIRREHQLLVDELERGLRRAIEIGAMLNEARSHFGPKGGFVRWVEDDLGLVHSTATGYMRLHHYATIIPSGLNMTEAITYLRGLPATQDGHRNERYPEQIKQEAVRRVKQGASHTQVANDLGISPSTVSRWATGRAYWQRSQRSKRAQRRLLEKIAKREESQRLAAKVAKQKGGHLAKTYSLVRQLTQELDAARTQVTDLQVRTELTEAITQAYAAETHIGRALGVDYGVHPGKNSVRDI